MAPYFKSYELCAEFVEQNLERKHRNMVCRKSRLWRKINQQQFNFFVTFTFDDKLHDEESFRKTLSRCLQHFSSRKGWLYIGVWERAPETKRLHFHGIFYIPEDIICPYGENDKKFILSDKFGCWDDGEYIGTVSPEVIARLPKLT